MQDIRLQYYKINAGNQLFVGLKLFLKSLADILSYWENYTLPL